MPVSPIFIGAFVLLFVFCVIVGLVSHLPIKVQQRICIPFRKLLCGQYMLLFVTEPCGEGGSNNSDFLVADVLENKDFALPVTLKLIQKG